MKSIRKRGPNRKKKGECSIVSKDFAEGKPPQNGHAERLDMYIKRSLELKRLGYLHHEVAEKLTQEFNLERTPSITSISVWINTGRAAFSEDIQRLQEDMRIEQFTDLEKMKRKFLALANAEYLEITRWVMEEGSLQPKLDENAVKEQIDAGNLVIKIMTRQSKLLGLDLEKSVAKKGEGPSTLQELQLWLIGQLSAPEGSQGQEQPKVIDVDSQILTLATGLPDELDEVEQDSDGV